MAAMTDQPRTDSPIYEAVTRGVLVRVVVSYLPQHSEPPSRYVWAYMVEIENNGDQAVQLISRHWDITDGLGRLETVDGDGVVGEQPVIDPGQTHRYTSGCPLTTDSGSMVGTYHMQLAGGDAFEAVIPAFSLDLPGARRSMN
jgi:ApaG protein